MTTNSNPWIYKEHPVTDISDLGENLQGFVYKITDKATGKIYIGKKSLISNRKKKLTKKELLEIPVGKGRRPVFKREITETDWKEYYGSSKTLLEEVKRRGKLEFEREILKLCKTKKQLTYWEVHYQCVYEVLIQDTYNDNILAKIFRADLVED